MIIKKAGLTAVIIISLSLSALFMSFVSFVILTNNDINIRLAIFLSTLITIIASVLIAYITVRINEKNVLKRIIKEEERINSKL